MYTFTLLKSPSISKLYYYSMSTLEKKLFQKWTDRGVHEKISRNSLLRMNYLKMFKNVRLLCVCTGTGRMRFISYKYPSNSDPNIRTYCVNVCKKPFSFYCPVFCFQFVRIFPPRPDFHIPYLKSLVKN